MIPVELLQDQNPWWKDDKVRRGLVYTVRRELQAKVLSRMLRQTDRRALLLMGPRQVGKTVLLLQTADDLLNAGWPASNLIYFDFSDDRLTTPVSVRDVLESLPVGYNPEHPRAILLDEVRLAPNWERWLKQAVDAGGERPDRIVATDSAASLLRDGTRESGQGRWEEVILEGLLFREFVRLNGGPEEEPVETLRRLSVLPERYLALGGYPEHALSDDFPEVRRRLRSDIADRALLRDLSRLGLDIQRVKDLFVYLVQDSGSELSAEARSRDLAADPRTVREWVRLLMDTFLLASLEKHHRNAAAALRSRSKVFAADPGLVTAFAPTPVNDPGVRARGFEAAVFRHLREVGRATGARLTYFRQRDDLEIDFVLEPPDGPPVGIEVTSSSRVRPEKVDRLIKAGKELGTDRLLLVHGGVLEAVPRDVVRSVPLSRFLMDPMVILSQVQE